MITKDDSAQGYRAVGTALLLASVLGVGLFVGRLTAPAGEVARSDPGRERSADAGITASPPAPLAWSDPDSALARLPLLRLEIEPEAAATLERARERAIAEGLIVQRPADSVVARVGVDGEVVTAQVRLKGDFLDHVDTDKWSLRIEVDSGTVFGMTRFSIQHPKTRGYLMEWLMMEAARREGLLAPRTRFVRVAINDRPSGIYYLEEHFTKEMLESQGRRDGPIIRLDEKTLWSGWLLFNPRRGEKAPLPIVFSGSPGAAEISVYDERRLAAAASLNQKLQRALEQMRDWKRTILSMAKEKAFLTLQSLWELQGRTIDELFVPDQLGRMLAVYTLFRAEHGFYWINMRFYYDALIDRLEPIMFDTGAELTGGSPELLVVHPGVQELLRSDRCYEEAFRSLGRMAAPDYVEQLLDELRPELELYAQALREEGLDPAVFDPAAIPTRLRDNADAIRDVFAIADAANFDCRLVPHPDADDVLEVEAWSTTAVPVEVLGFRFGNGRTIAAATAVAAGEREIRHSDGRVVLLRPGHHVRFRFPADARLAGLREIQDIKRAVRERDARDDSVKLRLIALHRKLSADDTVEEQLRIRRVDPRRDLHGRPALPDLLAAVEQHECLAYNIEYGRLFLRPGTWDVEGDLLIPDGQLLHAGPGVVLRFSKDAIFASGSPLAFKGQLAAPIVMEPQVPAAGWAGMIVFDTEHRSRITGLVVRGARSIERGGWQTTGGVTFYRAAVDLVQSRIEGALGEDALNIVSTPFRLESTTLQGGVSDLFDGDFVDGTIRHCTFLDATGDGLDLSGSRVQVEDCRFASIADKAMSFGEQSTVHVRRCAVESAGIALVSKDLSEVEVDDLTLRSVHHYGLAAYVKKPEYGPSTITARKLESPAGVSVVHLVQKGCSVVLDGTLLPGTDVDVEALYGK